MKVLILCFSIVFLLFSLIGCGPRTRYDWGNYNDKMYRNYKNPAQKEEFITALKEILDDAEQSGKVPPGLYAEYGFAMYEMGKNQQAVVYYEKEANRWPESKVFMTKLIAIVNNRAKNQKENAMHTVSPAVDAVKTVQQPVKEVAK